MQFAGNPRTLGWQVWQRPGMDQGSLAINGKRRKQPPILATLAANDHEYRQDVVGSSIHSLTARRGACMLGPHVSQMGGIRNSHGTKFPGVYSANARAAVRKLSPGNSVACVTLV